jgi:hypothetical protein
MTMSHEILAVLSSVPFLLSIFQQDMPSSPRPSDRQKAGYFGPVHKVSTETEILSRRLYRESSNGQKELIEDTTGQFGNGRFLTAEEEFDENGRLVADASSEREGDQGPFRSVCHYDANGRLSEEDHFNRDGSPVGRKHYVYDSAGKKSEELFYTASGVLLRRARYDEHQNVTDIESFGPDGSIARKQSIVHSYRREGNTLEDSYNPPQQTSGLLRVVSPTSNGSPEAAGSAPQQFKTVYTYNDSGQLIKELSGDWEKTYDSRGRLSVEVFGNTRTAYSYNEQDRITEMLVTEPPGALPSLSGGRGRYVYKYDSHGNEKERIVYNRDGSVSMHYLYTYEYDSHNNWTKRIEDEKVFNFREDIMPPTLEILSAEYRAISYH